MKTILPSIISLLIAVSIQGQTCNNFWSVVSPDGNYLYFSSDRHGGDYDIYRSNIDGVSGLMRLTTMTGNDFYPAISPDGSKVVFQNGDYNGNAEIYIMDNDGSNLIQLTNNSVYDGYPNFSPDGQTIVFSAWDASQYPEVFTMNVDGTGRTQLTNETGAYWQSAPKFNPTGDKIYFLAGFNADNHIVMMNTDGSNWVDITPANSFGYAEANLFFSPDGSQIIFFTTENLGYNNGSDLVIANADGSNWNYISSAVSGEYFYQACFHPTTGKLYYTYFATGIQNEIHRMDVNGTNSEQLSNCSLVGVDESVSVSEVGIYPNPASNNLRLQFSGVSLTDVKIYDALGKLRFSESGMKSTSELDISSLSNGIYFVELQSTRGQQVLKFVVER